MEARDTAASFRYFVNMEAEMEMMTLHSQDYPEIKGETHSATESAKPSNTSGSIRALENEPKETDRLQKSDRK